MLKLGNTTIIFNSKSSRSDEEILLKLEIIKKKIRPL